VNVFVPASANVFPVEREPEADTSAAVAAYREELQVEADRYGVELPEPDVTDTDAWEEKLDVVEHARAPVVSFTFGLPDRRVIARLQSVGSLVLLSVTDVDEAEAAIALSPDGMCIQGPLAGAHRATLDVAKSPGEMPLIELLTRIRARTDLPLIAAGGLTRAAHIAGVLDAGAVGVQLGTMFLRTPEAGTSAAYRDALASDDFSETIVTRAFSGRFARGLRNRFIRDHHDHAPAAYPAVNQLTRPLRAAATAAGDADGLSLWAGAHYRDTTGEPAGEITKRLWRECLRLRQA